MAQPQKHKVVDKSKAVDAAISQIQKQFGQGAIMRLGASPNLDISVIPTGIVPIDVATGIGGFPRGRIVEVYGPESSGKTTLALHLVAAAQGGGGVAAFIDAEHALDPVYAGHLGVAVDDLLVSQPDSGEQALEICELLVRSGAVDVIVIDSVAALVPRAELEGDMGEPQMGLQARLMSQAMRKLSGVVSKTKTCLLFINQIRMKIGVMFGNPETTTGGRALKFYSSLRLDVRRISPIKDASGPIGARTRLKIVKNKCAAPFKQVEFDIMYGHGISKEGALLDLAVEKEIVRKAGSWFSYKEERIGQGRENAKQFLASHQEIQEAIEAEVLAAVGLRRNDGEVPDKAESA